MQEKINFGLYSDGLQNPIILTNTHLKILVPERLIFILNSRAAVNRGIVVQECDCLKTLTSCFIFFFKGFVLLKTLTAAFSSTYTESVSND